MPSLSPSFVEKTCWDLQRQKVIKAFEEALKKMNFTEKATLHFVQGHPQIKNCVYIDTHQGIPDVRSDKIIRHAIAVDKDYITALSYEELVFCMAHELAHAQRICNGEAAFKHLLMGLTMFVSVVGYGAVVLTFMIICASLIGDMHWFMIPVYLIGVLATALMPIVRMLAGLPFKRSEELVCDAMAVRAVGPKGAVSLFNKMAVIQEKAPSWVLREPADDKDKRDCFIFFLGRTHPPDWKRVKNILRVAGIKTNGPLHLPYEGPLE